jgi:hypothetical protein
VTRLAQSDVQTLDPAAGSGELRSGSVTNMAGHYEVSLIVSFS